MFVEGGTSNVCINVATGNSANNGSLTIGHSGITKITGAANGNADELILIGANASANVGMSMISNNANQGIIYFGDEDDTDIGGIIYDHPTNDLVFQTNTSEKVRVKSGGDLSINDGNLVIGTSGKGINFDANTDDSSGISNSLLDDYEEGTWTPSLAGATSGTRPADSGHKSTYTKVGNIVHVTTSFGVGGLSGTASGKCRIEGLPFNYNGSNSAAVSSFFCSEVNLSASFLSVHIGNASSGTSNQFFPFAMRDDTSSSEIDFSSFDGDSAISFSISYQVA